MKINLSETETTVKRSAGTVECVLINDGLAQGFMLRNTEERKQAVYENRRDICIFSFMARYKECTGNVFVPQCGVFSAEGRERVMTGEFRCTTPVQCAAINS